ncbi:unnamed protein product [Phytomonas sp. EM1]|nr:unnamed protein product [Phytomonas sp. EM1]|eukprot:CCW60870.1 unnamed protein product [Phytomonas sp. isolate EM1]
MMGCGNESGPSFLERICTSIGDGYTYSKEAVCSLAGSATEGARNMVEKAYGSKKEIAPPASAPIAKAREVSSAVAEDLKAVRLNISGKAKQATSAVSDSKSSSIQCKCGNLSEKYGEAVVMGVKVAAAVLVVAGVAQGAFYCYRSRCKKSEKK